MPSPLLLLIALTACVRSASTSPDSVAQLLPGKPLNRESLQLGVETRTYQLIGLVPGQSYEVRVSHPASVGAESSGWGDREAHATGTLRTACTARPIVLQSPTPTSLRIDSNVTITSVQIPAEVRIQLAGRGSQPQYTSLRCGQALGRAPSVLQCRPLECATAAVPDFLQQWPAWLQGPHVRPICIAVLLAKQTCPMPGAGGGCSTVTRSSSGSLQTDQCRWEAQAN